MNLPTEKLKEFGIIEADNSFSKKLSAQDLMKFLAGETMVVDNDRNRATFQLSENNTKLNVNLYERDKNLKEVLKNTEKEIQYSDIKNINKPNNDFNEEKKVFVFDEKSKEIKEFDLLKDVQLLTQIITERKNLQESNQYKVELQKLQSLLQDRIDKFPEIAKEITNDLNIVSKEINTVNNISQTEKQAKTENKTDIQLNVNDPDLYEDANRMSEEQEEIQEQEKRKVMRR